MGWLCVFAMVNQVACITVTTSSAAVIGGEPGGGLVTLCSTRPDFFFFFYKKLTSVNGKKKTKRKERTHLPSVKAASLVDFQGHFPLAWRVDECSSEDH